MVPGRSWFLAAAAHEVPGAEKKSVTSWPRRIIEASGGHAESAHQNLHGVLPQRCAKRKWAPGPDAGPGCLRLGSENWPKYFVTSFPAVPDF